MNMMKSSPSSSLKSLAIAFLLKMVQVSMFHSVKVLTFCPFAFTKLNLRRNNNSQVQVQSSISIHKNVIIQGMQQPKSEIFSLNNDDNDHHNVLVDLTMSRRKFSSLISITSANLFSVLSLNDILFRGPLNASASDDLTSKMFNEDGSLKEGYMNGISEKDLQAKDKTVSVLFPIESPLDESRAIVSIDGKDIADASTSSSRGGIKASYNVPEKWTDAPDYLDTLLSSREKACDRISIYQVPGTFSDYSKLDKATTIGVAKALGFNTVPAGILPKTLLSADIVSGRKVSKLAGADEGEGKEGEKRVYYEYDLAVAPDTCGTSAENLGLGFCPYDTIVLLSATIIDGKMMVCAVTCTKDEWKRSNSDLKRVRNSFLVEKMT
mmetsp:Transcript_680/g.1188  ORF Transcript_680/g.1188 Transcript_680/m.1188 type:complete len:380 (-) Transcript_680:72-1211(-)